MLLSLNSLYVFYTICIMQTTYAAIDNEVTKKHNLSLNMSDLNLNLRIADPLNPLNRSIHLTNSLRIKDMLNFFDVTFIAEHWFHVRDALTPNCGQDMHSYLRGLNENSMWATKMDDASGHYASGFFYGNNYWLGSPKLCNVIYHSNQTQHFSATTSKGLPFAKVHTQIYNAVYNDNPPFLPAYYIVKYFLNETIRTGLTRTIYMGLCLPATCSLNDVRELSTFIQKRKTEQIVKIVDVRMPAINKNYLFNDRIFWILIVALSLVTSLMAAGTWYEMYLNRIFEKTMRQHDKEMMNSETSSGIGCASSEYSVAVTHERNKIESSNMVLPLNDDPQPKSMRDNSVSDEAIERRLREPKKLGVYAELLLSFSVITNYKSICDRNVGADTIPCIHGLRAFSMAWVILGHTCIVVFKYSDNMEKRKDVEQNFFFQAISNGAFSVDTFFFISGFLISYLYFRTNAKGNLNKLSKSSNIFTTGTAHFLGLVFYRFMRLTAPYMFVLGVVQVTMGYLAESSVFDPPTIDHLTCPKYWWRNILYINTLFPVEEMCMIWSWYLANDTQFYLIGAVILIIAVRQFKLAAGIALIFLLSAWFTTGVIAFNNNHRPNTDDPLALFDKIYDKPWTRLGPYLIGMAVGWILFRTNCKIRLSRSALLAAWTLSLLNLYVLLFGLYRSDISKFTAAAYSSLSHTAWSISLAWITIACSTGYGGWINQLLSAPWLYPFSRVTYCAYLVHPIVIRSLALSMDSALHLSGELMTILFFGLAVASYLLAFLVSISFEAPVVAMLKILSPNRKKRVV